MKVLEVKNNLVKISYSAQDNLIISGFVIVEDSQYAYVAQVMSLKADSGFNYAIIKLLFTFNDEGVVKNYNGSIPELDANITALSSDELLDILPIETPLTIGKLAQQKFILNIDFSALEKNLLICSDNVENTDIIVTNLAKQITANNCKSVIFDTTSTIKAENRLTLGVDFKLPLNYDTINFIYEHDLNDIEPTSKAIIQDILIEVQEYANTLIDKFIPFDLFVSVIDNQYKQTQMPELALLKSRLVKYRDENIFAQDAKDFHTFRSAIRGNLSTLVDISNVESELHKLAISYAYDEIAASDLFVYSIVKINNDNSDKKLMKKLITHDKVFSTIVCPHNYKYIHELKELANNLILFTPQTVQHDFSAYNVFLNKLNPDEAVIFGKATQNIPLILEILPYEDLERLADEYSDASQKSEIVEEASEDAFNEETDTYTQESMIEDGNQNYNNQEEVQEEVLETEQETDESNSDDEIFEEPVSNQEAESEQQDEIFEPITTEVPEITEEDESDVSEQDNEFEEQEQIIEDESQVNNVTEEDVQDNIVQNDVIQEDISQVEEPAISDEETADTPEIYEEQPEDALTEQDLDYIDKNPNLFEDEENISKSESSEPQNFADDIDEFNSVENVQPDMNNFENRPASENLESDFLDDEYEENSDLNMENISGNSEGNVVPIYPIEDDTPISEDVPMFEQGDRVSHPKYGEGVVEKMVKFGNKVLCSINFANGRRLLDPTISQIERI